MRTFMRPPRFSSTQRLLKSTPIYPQRHASSSLPSRQSQPNPHRDFYRIYGRALLKALTLAFLSYQIAYTIWLTFETEDIKDQKNREIKSLESEVRLLDEGRKMHNPSMEPVKTSEGRRLLEEGTRKV